MGAFIIILAAIAFSFLVIVKVVKSLADTNTWIKAPMSDDDLAVAVMCGFYGGDADEIMAHELEAKQELYLIYTSCVKENEGFTYSLYSGKDYFKISDRNDFQCFVQTLFDENIPYYAYRESHKTHEREKHPDLYETNYYIKVSEDDADKAYELFYSLDLDGCRYRYYMENGDLIQESF